MTAQFPTFVRVDLRTSACRAPGRLLPGQAVWSCWRRLSPPTFARVGTASLSPVEFHRRTEPAPTGSVASPDLASPGRAFHGRTEPAPTEGRRTRNPVNGMAVRIVGGPGDQGGSAASRGRRVTLAAPAAGNFCERRFALADIVLHSWQSRFFKGTLSCVHTRKVPYTREAK
jgi:hypothetical protein